MDLMVWEAPPEPDVPGAVLGAGGAGVWGGDVSLSDWILDDPVLAAVLSWY